MADTKKVGKVSHYFDKLGVAIVEITKGKLKVGDKIQLKGGERDFKQTIKSLELDHQSVVVVKKGDSAGLKVDEPVREGDTVLLVE